MLSDILGHESIETTRIYLHRSSTEQKQDRESDCELVGNYAE